MSLLKEFIAELPKNLKSNKNLKNYIKEFYKKHNIEQDDASESASREPLTVEMINKWAVAPSKGGLSMPDLKAKAEEYGVDVKGLKKAEIKAALLELAVPAAEVVKSKEPATSAEPVDFTADMVQKWTVKELKENAKRCGVEIKAKAKKDEIKDIMLAVSLPDPVDFTAEMVEKWTVRELEEHAERCGVDIKGMKKKAEIKTAMLAVALPGKPDGIEEDQEFTVETVEKWTAVPSKGGLTLKELKAKAEKHGVDIAGLKKKDEIKEALLAAAASGSSEPVKLTAELIDSWMAAPKKGGLSMTDLKAKAKEYGVDASKMKKKEDVKAALLEKIFEDEEVGEPDDEDEKTEAEASEDDAEKTEAEASEDDAETEAETEAEASEDE